MKIDISPRIRQLNENTPFDPALTGPIIYWMDRDKRVNHNWALVYAQELALKNHTSLLVIHCIAYPALEHHDTQRTLSFLIQGLIETQELLKKKHIPCVILKGDPETVIPHFAKQVKARALITDFSPLKPQRLWRDTIAQFAKSIEIPFYEIDTHNIVPCWIASNKQEYGARTIRPKITKLLGTFLSEPKTLRSITLKTTNTKQTNDAIKTGMSHAQLIALIDKASPTPQIVDWITPGEKAAKRALNRFIKTKLTAYDTNRNDPTLDGISNLSPYLNFGQLSAQYVAYQVSKSHVPNAAKAVFLEELIIRRELSDNYCFYNPHYDSPKGFPDWAQKTLAKHETNTRHYHYSMKELENAQTHDPLWNAAQNQMVKSGKMHGFMRMYWAKKILEWSKTPAHAFKTALALNDRYELDGRDPNGYVGVAWSIGGVHDRAWGSRPIFGTIRYMSYEGCKRKFSIETYIKQWVTQE